MFCMNCGKSVKDGAKFCPYCGTKQEPFQPEIPTCSPVFEPEATVYAGATAAPVEPEATVYAGATAAPVEPEATVYAGATAAPAEPEATVYAGATAAPAEPEATVYAGAVAAEETVFISDPVEPEATVYAEAPEAPSDEGEIDPDATVFVSEQPEPVWQPEPEPAWIPEPEQPAWEPEPEPQPGPIAWDPAPEQPADIPRPLSPLPKKKRKTGLVIGLTAGIAAVLAAALFLMFTMGVFASPSQKLSNAVTKSVASYAGAVKLLPGTELSGLFKGKGYSMELTAELQDIMLDGYYSSAASLLEGASVRVSHEFNRTDRELGLSLTPMLGSAELLTANIAIEDNLVYATVPELTDGLWLGADTETLGADLVNMGADLGEAECLSFNLFEILDILMQFVEENKLKEEDCKELIEAVKALYTEAEIEKVGKTTEDINGTDVECVEYTMLVSEDTIFAYYEAVKDLYLDQQSSKPEQAEALVEALLRAFGLTDGMVDQAMAELSFTTDAAMEEAQNEVFAAMEESLEELGDLELHWYVESGLIRSVRWEDSIYGTDVELSVDLGSDDSYTELVMLELVIEDIVTIELESTGNHTAKGGKYTDETVIKIIEENLTPLTLRTETEFDTETGELTFDLKAADQFAVSVEGTVTGEKNSLSVNLDEVSLKVEGEKVLAVGLDLTLTEYAKRLTVDETVLLSELTEERLEELLTEWQNNVMSWAMELYQTNPEILQLI